MSSSNTTGAAGGKQSHSDQQLLPLVSTNATNPSFLSAATAMTMDRNDHDDNNVNNNEHHIDDEDHMEMGDNSDTEALPAKRGMRQRRSTSRPLETLAQVVHWVQRWKIPRSWLLLRKSTAPLNASAVSSSTNAAGTTASVDHDMVSLISGVDRVVFGTASAAEAVLLCGGKPPQYLWYMLSGGICDVIQFFIDMALHYTLGIEDASLCWALGFGCSILFRHTTHRYLVFGDYVGGYQKSLCRMYGGYSIIIVISTVFNIIMTRLAKISHYAAWIITLLWTGIVNYFILKKLWSFGGKTTTTNNNNSAAGVAPSTTLLLPRGRTFSNGSSSGLYPTTTTSATTPIRGRTFSTGSTTSMTTPRERTLSSSNAAAAADTDKKTKSKIKERDDVGIPFSASAAKKV